MRGKMLYGKKIIDTSIHKNSTCDTQSFFYC